MGEHNNSRNAEQAENKVNFRQRTVGNGSAINGTVSQASKKMYVYEVRREWSVATYTEIDIETDYLKINCTLNSQN
jgi:hypothetical protein